MSYTAADIARLIQGEVRGDASTLLSGFAPASTAKPGELTFAENPAFFQKAELSAATAILVDGNFTSDKKVLIVVPAARIAYAKVVSLFYPEPNMPAGVHSTAVVSASAQIDPTAHVGPHCIICDEVKIGAGVVLMGFNFVGAGAVVKEESWLFPHVTLYTRTQVGSRVRLHSGTVIGSDGFGYVLDGGVHRKIPQVGNVIIQDDVEIGANVTIDCGALGSTVIGRGTKIDNLVQIAHNVTIGEHSLLVSQVGIAGSTKIGNYVTIAGQAGVAGHLKIGNKATIAGQSGVMDAIPDGEKWFGSPAQPDRRMKRQILAVQQLPALLKRVAELEARLGITPELRTRGASPSHGDKEKG